MCESFSLISQKWDGQKLCFSLCFKPSVASYRVNDFDLIFQLDIANENSGQIFSVPCKFTREKTGEITLDCVDYSFDSSLTFDQLTNFSVFRIINSKINFNLPLPTYCGSENGKDLTIEIFSPM